MADFIILRAAPPAAGPLLLHLAGCNRQDKHRYLHFKCISNGHLRRVWCPLRRAWCLYETFLRPIWTSLRPSKAPGATQCAQRRRKVDSDH